MKKVLFAVIAIAAISFTSCKKTENVDATTTVDSTSVAVDTTTVDSTVVDTTEVK